jgi:predicted ester cyclase
MPATPSTSTPENTRPSRAGRRFGIGIFSLIVGGITLAFTVEVINEAFSPTVTKTAHSGTSRGQCAIAAAPLWDALQRARRSAADAESEQAALSAFRQQLDPEWSQLPVTRGTCESDVEGGHVLAELISLRFEEEHAVRFEARGLAAARKRVQHWVQGAVTAQQ